MAVGQSSALLFRVTVTNSIRSRVAVLISDLPLVVKQPLRLDQYALILCPAKTFLFYVGALHQSRVFQSQQPALIYCDYHLYHVSCTVRIIIADFMRQNCRTTLQLTCKPVNISTYMSPTILCHMHTQYYSYRFA